MSKGSCEKRWQTFGTFFISSLQKADAKFNFVDSHTLSGKADEEIVRLSFFIARNAIRLTRASGWINEKKGGRKMSEARVYADRFQTAFSRQEDFLDFLKKVGKASFWDRRKSKDLRLVAFERESQLEKDLRKQYSAERLDTGILDDTLDNTGLLLKVKRNYYPVRNCAIRTILDRAGVSGPALKRLDKHIYVRILNDCLKVAKGEALVRFSEGKISAVLGGDSHEYAILDMEQLFLRSVEYLQEKFKGCTYMGGFYDHSMASALWALDGEDELLRAYKKELSFHGMDPEDMQLKPVLRISTSNTGESGANIFPMLFAGREQKVISLGSPLSVRHKGGATLQQFEEQLDMVYGKYQLAIGRLAELLTVEIQHPVPCMLSVVKKLNIPKRYAAEAADLFRAQYGEDPCTAYQVYYGISEVIFMLETEGESGTKIADMEEKVARALGIRWKDYDLAWEIK